MKLQLRKSQIDAAKIVAEKSTLLMADIGTGKTAVALTAIAQRPKYRTLLVSTVRICRHVWPEEVKLWAPDLAYACAAGLTPEHRHAVMEGDADIVGINFENLKWLTSRYNVPKMFPQIVLDESSKIENPQTIGFKSLKPFLPFFVWRLPMTGTPRANYLADFWGNAYLADIGMSLGVYREAFRQRFFEPVRTPFGRQQYKPTPGAEQEILAKLRQTSHRLSFDGEKPGVVESDIKIALNTKVESLQQTTSLLTKQIQFSSGRVYDDSGNEVFVHDDKYETLSDTISDANGEPIMIVYNYDHEKHTIQQRFPACRVLESAKDVADWNDGSIEMLLVHPRSCGHGLNIQHGGAVQLWFSPPPTADAELYAQTVGRLARSGQKANVVRVLRLVMAGTQDEAVYAAIAAKLKAQNRSLYELER